MAKFEHLTLNLNKGEILKLNQLRQVQVDLLTNGNIIYIYRSSKSKKVYIGQTRHFLNRHKQHYNGQEEKFDIANFDQVKILISQYFNGSALDDVENQLITYFLADNPKTKSSKIFFENNEIINRNGGNNVNDYKERRQICYEVILPFWENVLFKEGWVTTPTLDELRISSLVKYSPIKQLTKEQSNLITEILGTSQKHYVINGDAGTGKTVLLTHIVAKFLSENENKRIAVVVQPNWEKTANEIFKSFGMYNNNLTISTSTKLINKKEYYDIIVVDESHRLSRKGPKQHSAFNTIYKNTEFSMCKNHLEPILALGNQIILMYDVLQAIRPSNISREVFQQLTTSFEKRYLTTQFRIQTPEGKNYNSDDYVNGIKYLLYKDTGLLQYTNYDPNFSRSLFHDNSPDAYFGYYDDKPLENLIDWIDEDRNYHPEHINRVLSGLVEDWKQSDGKRASITHFHEGVISRRWNSTQENWVNAADDDAEDQIGSVFAVQGIDLNKVGVLIGNDLLVDSDGKLYGEPINFKNVNGKHKKSELASPEVRKEFTMFVLNIYYVLLTRGIDGIRIGFWHNDSFKEYFKKTLGI
ncbi:DUF2075 domain-containing protein [Lactococcus lactis]|uniref:DUF2075 domain-containing protein n=1 Tax=Lactococcus lactis TaxID=1358 RepID=UPI00071CD1C4|nr:DUF2075 domain-containing protein [Lactococcus lactis]KST97184.1 hypothetical protein KF196_2134 [Lactococcus lactis subsp. lactis]